MNPKIHPSFWRDTDLEEKPPEMKLTLLWMMTNPDLHFAGVFRLAPRRFNFETGLESCWLTKTIDALPKMFVVDCESVLIKNFIKYQFGTGQKLAANNMGKALINVIPQLPRKLADAIYEQHPELKPLQALHKPLQAHLNTGKALGFVDESDFTSPNSARASSQSFGSPPKDKGTGTSTGTGEGEGKGTGRPSGQPQTEDDAHIPTVDEVIQCGQGPSGVPESYCRHFHQRMTNRRLWLNSRQQLVLWRRELVDWWTKDRATWVEKTAPESGDVKQWQAELDAESDPKKRRELRQKIKTAGGAV